MAYAIIPTIFREGNISTLWGLQGAGKTNLACIIMSNLADAGYHVWTNIHFFERQHINEAKDKKLLKRGIFYQRVPDEIHVVNKLSVMLSGLLEHEKNVVVMDETGFFASSTEATSKKTTTMKRIGFIIRHFNSSMLLLLQSLGSIVPDLRTTLVSYQMEVQEYHKSRVWIISEGFPAKDEFGFDTRVFEEVSRFRYIPPTKLPFDSKFMPAFEFDIDLVTLCNRLGDPSLDTLKLRKRDKKGRTLGARIIDELVEEEARRLQKKERPDIDVDAEVERIMEETGKTKNQSIAVLANHYKVSPSWFKERCSL